MTNTFFIILKCLCVAVFAFSVFGFFRFVIRIINDCRYKLPNIPLEPEPIEPFSDHNWRFFKHKKTKTFYAYDALNLHLVIVQPIESFPTFMREYWGDLINRNLDLQKYLFDNLRDIDFTFKTITREEFLTAYNTK